MSCFKKCKQTVNTSPIAFKRYFFQVETKHNLFAVSAKTAIVLPEYSV